MRSTRESGVPDRLWAELDALARELGASREALLQQALLAFLRFHGRVPSEPVSGSSRTGAVGVPGRSAARKVLDTANDLERAIAAPRGSGRGRLELFGDHGRLATVSGTRFLIGRGRHCDLVIDSAKVSREHAVIQREPDGWWIEDLGSSNGTWFQRNRVERRRIAHGDEYFICAEKIRSSLS
jgi:hypothetical protein